MIYEMYEVHFRRDGVASHVIPFRRTLFMTEELAMAEKEVIDLRGSDPEVIAARRLVGIDSVEVRVGPAEVIEDES